LCHPASKVVIAYHPFGPGQIVFQGIFRQEKFAPQSLPGVTIRRQFLVAGIFVQQAVDLAQSVGGSAAPTIIPRRLDHSRRQRVPLYVAPAAEPVAFPLNDRTLETALPEMANIAVTPGVIMHVGTQQARHERRQVQGIGKLNQQVEVVGHQAIVIEPKTQALAITAQQTQEKNTILVFGENGVAVVPTAEDVEASGSVNWKRRAMRVTAGASEANTM